MTRESSNDFSQPSTSNIEWRILAQKDGEKIDIENQGMLDEIVLQAWFHLEQLDNNKWWIRIGDARILVSVEPDQNTRVDIERSFYYKQNGETVFIND